MMKKTEIVKVMVFILLPFILAIFALIGARALVFTKPVLSYEEENIYKYFSESPLIPEVPEIPEFKVPEFIKNPFRLVKPIIKEKKLRKPVQIKRKVYTWDLKLTVIGRKKRFAILNNILVKEGDIIDGFNVKEIGLNYVVLTRDERTEKVFIKTGG